MNFRTDSIGYAGDYNANGALYLLQTTDGGVHWNHYTGAQAGVSLTSVNFADSLTGVLAGNAGPNIIRYYGTGTYTTDTIMALGSNGSSSIAENNIPVLQVYPNPAHSTATVTARPDEVLTITDLTGRPAVVKSTYQNGGWILELEALTSGIYIIYNTTTKGAAKLVVR